MFSTEKKDFFISYNKANLEYAKWIGWVLEKNGGYSVILDRWDFKVGSNFPLEMHKAISDSKKTLAILSEHYLNAQFTHPEWSAVFAKDPTGEKGLLIPIRVEKCNIDGLLNPIVYIDLVDIADKQVAKKILLDKLQGNTRPDLEPKFPGEEIFDQKKTNPNKIENCFINNKCLANLKNRDFDNLIGRDDQLSDLLRRISPSFRQHITIVDGMGGVGKTSLVSEAAHLCKEARNYNNQLMTSEIPIFDAIIFTSAKTTELKSTGIKNLASQEKCLEDIYRTIARVLKAHIINQATAENQRDEVYRCLEKQSTLLIVDNMETLESSEKEKILSFLAELPDSTQAVITTREKLGDYPTISLAQLSEKDSLECIEQEAKSQGINIPPEIAQYLYQKYDGIPVAFKYSVGRIAGGHKIDPQVEKQKFIPGDIARFCFEESVSQLRGKPAHKLLMALALFQGSPTEESLAEVAGLSKDHLSVQDGLDRLKQLSLVKEEAGRYKILAITREYTKLEISNHSDFETAARKRLIQWYLNFTEKYGGLDWQDWYSKYKKLDQELNNIIGVLDWCAIHDQYNDVKSIWENIDNYVDLFGYWNLRLKWIDWLIEQASYRAEELATYVSLIANKAWVLMLIGENDLEEARKLLIKAWKHKKYSNPLIQTEIYKNLAVLDIHYGHYSSTLRWLKRAESLLSNTKISNKELIRYKILFNYYRGRVQCFQENYDNAEQIFKQIISSGTEIEWQRFPNYAVHRLGELALKRNDLVSAKYYLEKAWWIAKGNQEPRRMVLVLISLARLEQKFGNRKKACIYDEEAKQIGYNNSMCVGDREDLQSLDRELGCDLIDGFEEVKSETILS